MVGLHCYGVVFSVQCEIESTPPIHLFSHGRDICRYWLRDQICIYKVSFLHIYIDGVTYSTSNLTMASTVWARRLRSLPQLRTCRPSCSALLSCRP